VIYRLTLARPPLIIFQPGREEYALWGRNRSRALSLFLFLSSSGETRVARLACNERSEYPESEFSSRIIWARALPHDGFVVPRSNSGEGWTVCSRFLFKREIRVNYAFQRASTSSSFIKRGKLTLAIPERSFSRNFIKIPWAINDEDRPRSRFAMILFLLREGISYIYICIYIYIYVCICCAQKVNSPWLASNFVYSSRATRPLGLSRPKIERAFCSVSP